MNTNKSFLESEFSGDGSPEGVIKAQIGAIYRDLSSAAVYRKTTGTSLAIGWTQDNGEGTGTIKPWGSATIPAGWLLCFGQAINRTTYSALFTVLGTTFGVGDGSTTFNIPDLRGRVPAGKDDMGGSPATRLTSTTISPNGQTLGATGGDQEGFALTGVSTGSGTNVVNTVKTVQPTLIFNYIIKT